jgi:hypothetical protein
MRSGSETASISTVSDPHLSMIRRVFPRTPNGCAEGLLLRGWVHLRLYLTCGHVGCCDSSPLRHARTVGHPIVRSSNRARAGADAMPTNSTSESQELTDTPDLNGAHSRPEVLFREGDRDCQRFVVLAGKVASVEGHGTPEERVISVHGRGRFLGEPTLLTGEGSAGPGLSRHLPADAGDRAERLAAGARRDGDHPGVPGPVRRATGRRRATASGPRRRQCR